MKNIINNTDVPVKKESPRRSQVSKYNSAWSLLDQILDLFHIQRQPFLLSDVSETKFSDVSLRKI